MYNSNNNKDKMITHRGLDCCASLNIGGRALLALHRGAPVVHQLFNNSYSIIWSIPQWTVIIDHHHFECFLNDSLLGCSIAIIDHHEYILNVFLPTLLSPLLGKWTSSHWCKPEMKLVLCASWHQLWFEFSEDGDLNMVLMSPLCWQGRIAQRGHFRKQSRSLFYWRGKEGREGSGWVA